MRMQRIGVVDPDKDAGGGPLGIVIRVSDKKSSMLSRFVMTKSPCTETEKPSASRMDAAANIDGGMMGQARSQRPPSVTMIRLLAADRAEYTEALAHLRHACLANFRDERRIDPRQTMGRYQSHGPIHPVEPLSGYRLIWPEDESPVIYLAPDANDEELGRALLESLDRSRFIHPTMIQVSLRARDMGVSKEQREFHATLWL